MTASRPAPARCRSSTPPGPQPGSWTSPGGLHARFGRDAAHGEWFCGFRLAIKTDLGSRLVRAWGIVPAAVNERDAGNDLLETGPGPAPRPVPSAYSDAAGRAAPIQHSISCRQQRHRVLGVMVATEVKVLGVSHGHAHTRLRRTDRRCPRGGEVRDGGLRGCARRAVFAHGAPEHSM